MTRQSIKYLIVALAALLSAGATAQNTKGEIKGHALQHTEASRVSVVSEASVFLPAQVVGKEVFNGKFNTIPAHIISKKVPVIIFLHGSSGLGLKAISEWQSWLADNGLASVAPDSFALPDRVSYTSPIDKDTYEKIHALRQSEIAFALTALRQTHWADMDKIILAGASEGGVPVARNDQKWLGRMIFSWSCENNYFVTDHQTYNIEEPVLNVISSTDPFFSTENPWLGNPAATGNCAKTLKQNKSTTVVLIPGAPHTLLNLSSVRVVTKAWLTSVLGSKE